MRSFKRKVLPLLASTVMVASAAPIFSAATASAEGLKDPNTTIGDCAPVHVMTFRGTGGSNNTNNTGFHDPLSQGENSFVEVLKRDHPGKVSFHEIKYSSSAGALYSAIQIAGQGGTTYGDSRLDGDAYGVKYAQEYKKKCPDSKLAIIGYSQGGSVGGDVAALLANGAAKNVTAEDIISVILIADPGNGGGSSYSGPSKANKAYVPIPEGAEYGKNGEFISSPVGKDRTGWTGQRSLPFTGLEGRVISLCNPKDMACSTKTGSVMQDIADLSDKDIYPNDAYQSETPLGGSALGGSLPQILSSFVSADVIKGLLTEDDWGPTLDTIDKKIDEKEGIDNNLRGQMHNAVNEIREMFKILHSEKGYGPNVTDKQIIGHILSYVNQHGMDMINIPDEWKAGISLAIPVLAKDSMSIPEGTRARMEQELAQVEGFARTHGSYYMADPKVGHHIGSTPSAHWGAKALSKGIATYLSGNSFTVEPGSSPAGDLEVANPNRKDDGLRDLLKNFKEGVENPRENPNGQGGDPHTPNLPDDLGGSDGSDDTGSQPSKSSTTPTSSQGSEITSPTSITTPSISTTSEEKNSSLKQVNSNEVTNTNAATSSSQAEEDEDNTKTYGSCVEASQDDATTPNRGEEGYDSRLDRDGDGISCNSLEDFNKSSATSTTGSQQVGPKVDTGGKVDDDFSKYENPTLMKIVITLGSLL